MRESWALLVKPTHSCNLNCQYCYDKPMRDKYKGKKMDFALVDKILKLCSEHAKRIQWIWHGGEPTLMGIEWYERVQELFYKYYGTEFKQSMQSNGLLLNKDWAKFSLKYDVDIGVSYDVFSQNVRIGNKNVNVEDNIKEYMDAGGKCGVITVINKNNYHRQIELYEYFKKLGTNPAFNHIYRSEGTLKNDLEISAEDYAREFLKYFKHYMEDSSSSAIDERTALVILRHVVGNRDLVCTYADCRHSWISVNPLGIMYPCDRYVPERYSMGNIMDFDSIEDIYKTDGHKLYFTEIQKRLITHCAECGYRMYCNGGCNANHIAVSGDGTGLDSFSCELFKLEFNGVYDYLRNVDFYKKSYNPHFVGLALSHPIISLNEIKEFMASKGFNTNWEYRNNGKELLDCQEFKMFRAFNRFKGEDDNGHVNYTAPIINVDARLTEDFTFEGIKESRLETINDIFNKNINEILAIVKGVK